MKRIIMFMALLVAFACNTQAQSINRVKGIWYYQVLGSDSALKLPLDTLQSAPVGSIAVKNDIPYFKNTAGVWLSLAGAVANLATTNLVATGDYTQNWNNKQLIFDSVSQYYMFARAKNFGRWNRINITAVPSSPSFVIQNVTRKADNSQDSATAVYQTSPGHIHHAAGDIAGRDAILDLNAGTPGAGRSAIIAQADTIRMQFIPQAGTPDSIVVVGPYDPATKTNPLYKFKFPSIPSGLNLSNIGFGYRWLFSPDGQFRTAVGRTGVKIDSLSDGNALTFRADTDFVATKTFAQARQISDSSFVSGSDTIRIRRLGYARNIYKKAAVGIAASSNVTNYPATKVDSIFYKYSTSPYGSGSAQDYGGWLTNNLTGDSIKISTPFWVGIGNSIMEGHPTDHGRLHPTIDLTKDDIPGQITYYLRQLTNMRYFNHGIGGQTSSQIWARWDRDVLAKTVAGITTLTEKPQGVIIECGINDFYNGISVATLKQNLIKMAASCAREGIYCVILTVPGDEFNNYTQNKQVDEINYWLRTGALNRYHVAIVDFNKWWKDAAYNDNMHGNSLLIDDIHLTPAGYDSLANYIYKEAKLPRLESIIVHTELSPDGFTGYSRPTGVSFNNTSYTIDAAIDTLPVIAPLGIDTAWFKINTSASVTGTTYTGISHLEYVMSYPVDNNLFTNGKESAKQTLYPYITLKDGKIGIQTENPSTPVEINTAISRTEPIPVGPELRSYINLAGGQSANSHLGKGGFYIIMPDPVDGTFYNMELDFTDAARGPSKMIIGSVNHQAVVNYSGYMGKNPPAYVKIGSTTGSSPSYLIIGDSTYDWDYAVCKISKLYLYAGFSLGNYAAYDTVQVRFTSTPRNLFNSLSAAQVLPVGFVNAVYNASNGLNSTINDDSNVVKLGGPLTEKTTIYATPTDTYDTTKNIIISGRAGYSSGGVLQVTNDYNGLVSSSSTAIKGSHTGNGYGVQGFSTTGTGVLGSGSTGVAGSTANGTALYAQNFGDTTGLPLYIDQRYTTSGSQGRVYDAMIISRGAYLFPSNGYGNRIKFNSPEYNRFGDPTGRYQTGMNLEWVALDFTGPDATSEFNIDINGDSALRKVAKFNGRGFITWPQYANGAAYNYETIDTSFASLVVDANGKMWKRHGGGGGGGGGTYTFSNGITESAGAVKLGGALTAPTSITSSTAANTLGVTGVNGFADGAMLNVTSNGVGGAAISGVATNGGRGVYGETTGDVGVYGNATNFGGIGVYARSTYGDGLFAQSDSGIVIEGMTNPLSNYNVIPTMVLTRSAQSAGNNGIGQSIDFNLKTSTSDQLSNQIVTKWTDATNASRTSQLEFYGVNSATTGRKLAIGGNGDITADGYGSGAKTGTIASYPAFASDGKIIEYKKVKYVQTADASVVANDVETTLISTGVGSLTIPANTMQAGKSYRLTVRGKYSTSGTNPAQMNWRSYFGATAVLDPGNAGLGTGKTDKGYQITCDFTVRSTGSSGSIQAQGMFFTEDGPGAKSMPGTLSTINTTIDQTFNFTVDFNDGTAGNSCYVYILIFEEI